MAIPIHWWRGCGCLLVNSFRWLTPTFLLLQSIQHAHFNRLWARKSHHTAEYPPNHDFRYHSRSNRLLPLRQRYSLHLTQSFNGILLAAWSRNRELGYCTLPGLSMKMFARKLSPYTRPHDGLAQLRLESPTPLKTDLPLILSQAAFSSSWRWPWRIFCCWILLLSSCWICGKRETAGNCWKGKNFSQEYRHLSPQDDQAAILVDSTPHRKGLLASCIFGGSF